MHAADTQTLPGPMNMMRARLVQFAQVSRFTRVVGCLVTLALVTSLGATAAPPPAAAPPAQVQATDAWIRWLPADVPSAGYMTLVNTGTVGRVLVAVTSAAYAEVSIHQSQETHGMAQMRPVSSLALDPQVPVHFAEGGYHLMLMQPRRPIHAGDTVIMTLHFAKAAPLDVAFSVRAGG